MDENKRDFNKTKRNRSDHVKLALVNYLQKRNYPIVPVSSISAADFVVRSWIESKCSRPNSVLYSCYNSDPIVIDVTFTKFLLWVKDLVKHKKLAFDLETLVPPLFCHLYLDILKGGHSERAASFFKAHSPTVEKLKYDDFIKDLLISFANDQGDSHCREQFRSNKYCVYLSSSSVNLLKKFIAENCHVVFLQIVQSWFDIREAGEECEDTQEYTVVSIERDTKFHELKGIIRELKEEPKPVLNINVCNTREEINCGVIKRTSGIIAYSQHCTVRVKAVHPYDTVVAHQHYKEVTLHGHSDKVYSMAVSSNSEYLATASSDCNVGIFDLINFELISFCKGHTGPVYAVAISSPPMFVASGSVDSTARLWSINNGHLLRVFIGHTLPITCIRFHPNNIYLITGSADRTLRLWNIESGKAERLFHAAKGIIFAVEFHPNGQYVASSSDDKRIQIWDILTSRLLIEAKNKDDVVIKLAWSKDGKQLATGTVSGGFRLWNFDYQLENNTGEVKLNESDFTIYLHAKILDIEYFCDSFSCLTY